MFIYIFRDRYRDIYNACNIYVSYHDVVNDEKIKIINDVRHFVNFLRIKFKKWILLAIFNLFIFLNIKNKFYYESIIFFFIIYIFYI